jgi:hypothetical protein
MQCHQRSESIRDSFDPFLDGATSLNPEVPPSGPRPKARSQGRAISMGAYAHPFKLSPVVESIVEKRCLKKHPTFAAQDPCFFTHSSYYP